ncbi:MAG: hypothetical protein R3293_22600 [Candidatus Promineifilaceae bacterium]|nr:hypothetical protein [Candidatus Promineifilaceae bacterium]
MGQRQSKAQKSKPNPITVPGIPTSYFGRQQELIVVPELPAGSRLVTLTGAAGSIKTTDLAQWALSRRSKLDKAGQRRRCSWPCCQESGVTAP